MQHSSRRIVLVLIHCVLLLLSSPKNAGSFVVPNLRFGHRKRMMTTTTSSKRISHHHHRQRVIADIISPLCASSSSNGKGDNDKKNKKSSLSSSSKSKKQQQQRQKNSKNSSKNSLKRDIAKRLTITSKDDDESTATLLKKKKNFPKTNNNNKKVKGSSSTSTRKKKKKFIHSSNKGSNKKKVKVMKRIVSQQQQKKMKSISGKSGRPSNKTLKAKSDVVTKSANSGESSSLIESSSLPKKKRSIKTPSSSKSSTATVTATAASLRSKLKSTVAKRRMALTAKRRKKRRGGGGSLGFVFNETLKGSNSNNDNNNSSAPMSSSILPPPLPRPTQQQQQETPQQQSSGVAGSLSSWEEFMRSRSSVVNSTTATTSSFSTSEAGSGGSGDGAAASHGRETKSSLSTTKLPSIAELFPKQKKAKNAPTPLSDTTTTTTTTTSSSSSSSRTEKKQGVLQGVLPVSELFYRAPGRTIVEETTTTKEKSSRQRNQKKKKRNKKTRNNKTTTTTTTTEEEKQKQRDGSGFVVRRGINLVVNGKIFRLDPPKRCLKLSYKFHQDDVEKKLSSTSNQTSSSSSSWAKTITLNTNLFGPLLSGNLVNQVSDYDCGLYCESFVSNAMKWNICPKDLSDLVLTTSVNTQQDRQGQQQQNAPYTNLLASTFVGSGNSEQGVVNHEKDAIPDFPPDFGDFIESLNHIDWDDGKTEPTATGEEEVEMSELDDDDDDDALEDDDVDVDDIYGNDEDDDDDEMDEEDDQEDDDDDDDNDDDNAIKRLEEQGEATIDDTDDFEGEEGANVNLIFSEVENLILKEKRMEETNFVGQQQQQGDEKNVLVAANNDVERGDPPSPYNGILGPRMLDAVVQRAKENYPRVIAIGDVHGCIDELQDLLRACDYHPGDLVVFLGDLVCKGPDSTSVVQMAREIGAIGIRGNHDSEVIRWAQALKLGAYPPVVGREHFHIASSLTDEDTEWLKSLPWYIQSWDLNALFVHAGFVSGVKLSKQNPRMMMNMRSILPDGTVTSKFFSNWPWARLWDGPQTVLFGHDADRGLQQYENAIGLDTGCVYGGRLTACILPERRLVSVSARREYFKFRRKRYP